MVGVALRLAHRHRKTKHDRYVQARVAHARPMRATCAGTRARTSALFTGVWSCCATLRTRARTCSLRMPTATLRHTAGRRWIRCQFWGHASSCCWPGSLTCPRCCSQTSSGAAAARRRRGVAVRTGSAVRTDSSTGPGARMESALCQRRVTDTHSARSMARGRTRPPRTKPATARAQARQPTATSTSTTAVARGGAHQSGRRTDTARGHTRRQQLRERQRMQRHLLPLLQR